jgi:hypothetical protein
MGTAFRRRARGCPLTDRRGADAEADVMRGDPQEGTVVKKVEKKVASKKAEPKKSAKKGAVREILVVGSKVKEVIKAHEMRADGELIAEVSCKVHALLTEGIARAKANNRKTVTPKDL